MRIDVVGRDIEVTDAIREHAVSKSDKLPRYFDGVQQITFTIAKEDHHLHGNFDVEVIVDVEHHPNFVAHAKNMDVYAAIDQTVQKAARQLTDYKEKLKGGR